MPLEIPKLLEETLDFLSNEFLQRHVEVKRRYATTGRILGDPQQIKQIFLNLFLNSLDAMTPPPARLPGGPAPSGAVPPLAEAAGGGVIASRLFSMRLRNTCFSCLLSPNTCGLAS